MGDKEEEAVEVESLVEKKDDATDGVKDMEEVESEDSGKELHIEKGRGTALKDIPNVAHNLSRKKNEETCKLLHTILFGTRGKASQVKSNISQFSGFLWHANEDKQKNKIKEKLDKCVEENLLELCNVLDLPIAKTTARKEDVVTELLEFFEAPQATSDELLADKEVSSKGNKRKRSSKKSTSNLGAHLQKAQLSGRMCSHGPPGAGAESKEATKKRKRVTEAVEEKSPIPKKSTSKDIAGKKVLKGKEKKPEGEKLEPSDTEVKNATCELLKELDCNTATITDILKLLVKRFNTDLVPRISTIRRTIMDEIEAKGEKLKPSDAELKNATCELLKEMDCKTATIPDILKLLVKRFNTGLAPRISTIGLYADLVPRISTIRRIIMDEIKARGEKLKASDTELKNATCELFKELKPSDTELKNATCELLKEVDCKTATITDFLKLLVKRFNTDLLPRKATIRRIILDELTKMF